MNKDLLTTSGPYTHENLTIFLFHAHDQIDGSRYISLKEALEQEEVRVCETGTVGQLDRQATDRIAEDWKDAYNAGDAAKVAALYTEDGYYLSAHILAHGRKEIEAYWRRGILAGGHVDFIQPLTVFASGELGYTAGTYQATNAGVTVDGRILLVFKKINGKWLIAAHETVVRDQP